MRKLGMPAGKERASVSGINGRGQIVGLAIGDGVKG